VIRVIIDNETRLLEKNLSKNLSYSIHKKQSANFHTFIRKSTD